MAVSPIGMKMGHKVTTLPSTGVVAIVVDYNVGSPLAEAVKSALAQLEAVVVVDHGGSSAAVLEHDATCAAALAGGRVLLVVPGANGGFARGCNAGVRAWEARQGGAAAYLFLNPDALLAPGAVAAMLALLQKEPLAGAVGPRVLDVDGSVSWGAARRMPGAREVWLRWGLGRRLAPVWAESHRPFASEMISGACLLVRAEAFRAVGGWDEGYFLHFEDMDLCLRLRAAGWGVWVEPRAECVHEKGRCSGRYEAGWAGWRRRAWVGWHKHRAAMRFLHRYWFRGWRWVAWPVVMGGVWGHALLELIRPAR